MTKLYWLIPALLVIFQLIFTLNSFSQIRYEDLAEGVRNPFWLENRVIYDGTSSNIGWYGSLLAVYKVFGFSLFTALYFKLFLFALSIFCLSSILKKYLGEKLAVLPLLVVGLSPSWLFLNTLQTSYGTDLLYFPIALFLILSQKRLLRVFGWSVAMLAWMSYPTFIFYLPALLLVHMKVARKSREIVLGLIFFLIPLLIGFLYVENRSILFFDPNTEKGIFRGAGTIALDGETFTGNLGGLFRDLFISGQSYHFELKWAEFSFIFPIIALVFFLERRGWVVLTWVMLLLAIIIPSLTLDPSGQPGMRRYTPVLAYLYALLILIWKQQVNFKFQISNFKLMAFAIILIHHILVYPINLSHLSDPSPFKEPTFFNNAPISSLNNLVEVVTKNDLKLDCKECRLAEVYASVAGSCIWNNLECNQILGYDITSNQFIPLSTKLWEEYYLEH